MRVNWSPDTFRADAILIASTPDAAERQNGIAPITAPELEFDAYQDLLTLDEVSQRAASASGVDAPLPSLRLKVNEHGKTAVLELTAVSDVGDKAVDYVNAYAEALVGWDRDRASLNVVQLIEGFRNQEATLQAQIDAIEAGNSDENRGSLTRQLEGRQNQRAYAEALLVDPVGQLGLADPALSARPLRKEPLQDAVIAGLIAALAVYALGLVASSFRSRILDPESFTEQTGIPVLKTIDTARPDKEVISYLAARLTSGSTPQTLLVTDLILQASRPYIALQLAVLSAQQAKCTLLLDHSDNEGSVVTALSSSQVTPVTRLSEAVPAANVKSVPGLRILKLDSSVPIADVKSALKRWQGELDTVIINAGDLVSSGATAQLDEVAQRSLVLVNEQTQTRQALELAYSRTLRSSDTFALWIRGRTARKVAFPKRKASISLAQEP